MVELRPSFIGMATLDSSVEIGNMRAVMLLVNGPSSYEKGGFFVEIPFMPIMALVNASGGYVAEARPSIYRAVNIVVYQGGSEVADGTDLSSITFTIFAVGFMDETRITQLKIYNFSEKSQIPSGGTPIPGG